MFRNRILKSSKKYFEGEIAKHVVNVEVMLDNTVGVGEHPDIVETIEKELEVISNYHDKLEMLNTYFKEA
tara:strand:+ start:6313 stop:6522 length:210 start_codon:yes stop_codon:yes gene_type:complete